MSYELIGITGTVLILIGFLSNSEKRIRIFDMIGSICFVLYGALVHAWSNILLDGILIIVHLYKLNRIGKREVVHNGKESQVACERAAGA